MRNVTSIHFGYSCVDVHKASRAITVDHCACLEPVFHIQLAVNVLQMAAGGFDTGAQAIGNLFVEEALRQTTKHLVFATGQGLQPRREPEAMKIADDLARDFGGHR